MKFYIYLILLLGLSSCTLTEKELTQEEKKVRITQNSSSLPHCGFESCLNLEIFAEEVKLATTLTKEEKKVRITRNSSSLSSCKKINTVTVNPQYKKIKIHPEEIAISYGRETRKTQELSRKISNWLSTGWQIKTKIRTVKEGGNTVYVRNTPSHRNVNVFVEVYRCP